MLDAALDRARAGSGSVVLIAGEAGIGKSRLTSTVMDHAESRGMSVLVGECLPLGDGELPYGPIVGALRALVRDRSADELMALTSAGHDELARLLPDFGSARDGGGSQARLFEQLLAAFTGIARQTPLLLVIEDLHWSDRATRDFLAFLTRAIRTESVLVVVTYRSDEVARAHTARQFVHELERSGHAHRIELTTFDRQEVHEQVGAILGQVPTARLVDVLFDRAEGNPFFTEELLASAREEEAQLPESVRQGLLLRLTGCSDDVSRVIRALSVEGKQIEHRLLAAVLDLPAERLLAALRDAIDRHVIVHAPGATRYAFRHSLLCEAAYSDLLPIERQQTHAALAAAIAADPTLGGTRAATTAKVAQHWHAAGDAQRAFPAALQAATEAERIYAADDALLHYELMLALWDVAADQAPALGVTRTGVLQRASEAAARAGDPARAVVLARQALGGVDADDPVAQAHAHATLGRRLWDAGRNFDALPQYRRAVELMPDAPTCERAAVLAGEAQMLMLCHEVPAAVERCAQALALARQIGERGVEANVLNTMAATLSYSGRPQDGVEVARAARTIASELEMLDELGRGYINGAYALDQSGKLAESIALSEQGLEVIGVLGGDKKFGDCLRAEIAERALRTGDWNRVEDLIECLFDDEPTGLNAGHAYDIRALLHARRGAHAETLEAVLSARAFAERSGGWMWPATATEAQATVELWDGTPAQAARTLTAGLDDVDDGAPLFTTIRLYELAVRAAVEQALAGGNAAELTDQVHALLADADRRMALIEAGPTIPIRASRQTADAELSRIDGSDPDAWESAAELWREYGDQYQFTYARFRLAEALLALREGRPTAQEVARDAHAAAVALGARPLISAIELLARRGRLELPITATDNRAGESSPVDAYELTPRELEVFALVGEGMTNREIAAELFISEKTASVHVSRILAKLSVANRASAAAAAQRLGVGRVATPAY